MSCRVKPITSDSHNNTVISGQCELILGMKYYGADSDSYFGKNQLAKINMQGQPAGVSLDDVKEGLTKMFQTLPIAKSLLPPDEKLKFEQCLPAYKKHIMTALLPACNGQCEERKYCSSSCSHFHKKCIDQNLQSVLQTISKSGSFRGLLYSVAGHEGSVTLRVVDAALKTLSEDACTESEDNFVSEKNATCATSTHSKCEAPKPSATKPSATRQTVLQLIREVQTVQKKLDGMTHDMKAVMYKKCKGGCNPVGMVVDDESGIAIAPPQSVLRMQKQVGSESTVGVEEK